MNIYENNMWTQAKTPSDLGRKDWNHNPEGQVDYLPLGVGNAATRVEVPLCEQKYDYEEERRREEAASNLAICRGNKPDWKEYDRIQSEFN